MYSSPGPTSPGMDSFGGFTPQQGGGGTTCCGWTNLPYATKKKILIGVGLVVVLLVIIIPIAATSGGSPGGGIIVSGSTASASETTSTSSASTAAATAEVEQEYPSSAFGFPGAECTHSSSMSAAYERVFETLFERPLYFRVQETAHPMSTAPIDVPRTTYSGYRSSFSSLKSNVRTVAARSTRDMNARDFAIWHTHQDIGTYESDRFDIGTYYIPVHPRKGLPKLLLDGALTVSMPLFYPIDETESEARQRYTRTEQVDDYTDRISEMPDFFEGLQSLGEDGIEAGFVPSETAVAATIDQLDQLIANDTIFIDSVNEVIDTIPGTDAEDIADLKAKVQTAVTSTLMPSIQLYRTWVETTYGSMNVSSDSMRDLNMGTDLYNAELRATTTVDITGSQASTKITESLQVLEESLGELADAIGSTGSDVWGPFNVWNDIRELNVTTTEALNTLRLGTFQQLEEMPSETTALPRCPVKFSFGTVAEELRSPYQYIPSPRCETPAEIIIDTSLGYSEHATSAVIWSMAYPGAHTQLGLESERTSSCTPKLVGWSEANAFAEAWKLFALQRANEELALQEQTPEVLKQRFYIQVLKCIHLLSAKIDVDIHYGGETPESALDNAELENVGRLFNHTMWLSTAAEESVQYPGAMAAPWLGYLAVLDLRSAFVSKLGDNYSQRDFHNFLLSIPPTTPIKSISAAAENYFELLCAEPDADTTYSHCPLE